MQRKGEKGKGPGTAGKLALVFALVAAVVFLGGCGQKAAPPAGDSQGAGQPAKGQIVLKYAFFAAANTFPARQMDKWAEEVEKRTGGKVKVQKYPGGSLLTAQNMFDGVLKGVADIGLSCPSYEPGRFPLTGISDQPVGYPNARVASLVLYDLLQEFRPEELAGFKVITAFNTEPAYIQSKKPVRRLEDIAGLRLRTAGTGVPVLEALGGKPVGMSQADVAQALQTGVIDGYLSSREVLYDLKYAETTKYVTDFPLASVSFVAVMNKDVWNSLPPEVQQVIDGLGREMALWTGTYLDNHVKESLAWAEKEQGLQVISLPPEEKARWEAALQGVTGKYVQEVEARGLPGREFLNRLLALKEKYAQEYR
jgi:TRAP-type C4-dicarboxylate transport system substrate-binding protein